MALLAVADTKSLMPFLLWLGVVIAIAIGLCLVILFLRGRLLARNAGVEGPSGLLASLRQMRDRGELSVEEYDAARKGLVAKAAGRAPGAAPISTPNPTRPHGKNAPGGLHARPGFDLTGAPLPKPDQGHPPAE